MMRAASFLAAAALLTASPAPALAAPSTSPHFQAAPAVELARHHKRHRHHRAAASAGGAALGGLFWPLDSATQNVRDPACALVGCAPGWTLGPLAWGLYGVGFSDPLGLWR